jgi:hypothetical protein
LLGAGLRPGVRRDRARPLRDRGGQPRPTPTSTPRAPPGSTRRSAAACGPSPSRATATSSS